MDLKHDSIKNSRSTAQVESTPLGNNSTKNEHCSLYEGRIYCRTVELVYISLSKVFNKLADGTSDADGFQSPLMLLISRRQTNKKPPCVVL